MNEKDFLAMLVTSRVSELARAIQNRQVSEIEDRNGGQTLPYAEWPSIESCLPEAAAIFKTRHRLVMGLLDT